MCKTNYQTNPRTQSLIGDIIFQVHPYILMNNMQTPSKYEASHFMHMFLLHFRN